MSKKKSYTLYYQVFDAGFDTCHAILPDSRVRSDGLTQEDINLERFYVGGLK